MRPGGRFVGEFGGHLNVAAIRVALHVVLQRRGVDGPSRSPWYFPTPAAYSALLQDHGFQVRSAQLVPRPTPLPTDVGGWMDTFAENFFAGLPAEERPAAKAEAIDLLRPILCDTEGNWTADYVRLRFAAVKPA